MPRDHPVPCLQNLGVGWELLPMERPVRVIVQLLVALVEAIGRQEKGDRVGDMDGHRHVQLAARLPHGIEAGIVDGDEFAGGDVLSQIQSESFEDLQTPGTGSLGIGDGIGLDPGIARLQEPVVAGFGEGQESAGMRLVVACNGLRKALSKAAGEVLCADLQAQLRGLQVIARRLPRLPTDQTSSLVPMETADALTVMLRVVREMHATEPNPG